MAVAVMPVPWELYAGDSAALVVKIEEGGNPVDLSIYEDVRCQWRSFTASPTAVDLVVDVSDAADGEYRIYVTPEQSAVDGGMVRSGVWDLQVSLEGDPRTLIRGQILWREDVTR